MTEPINHDYTLRDAAAILRRSIDRVRRMAKAGDLDRAGAYQLTVGGVWRFRRADFDRWHDSLRAPQADPYMLEPPSARSLARRKKPAA